jgi:hypothetical protein
LFQYYYDSMSALKPQLVNDLNRDHLLEVKNVELKIQRLVDINRGEEDDHLFNERQSRETMTIKKIQKIKTAGEN